MHIYTYTSVYIHIYIFTHIITHTYNHPQCGSHTHEHTIDIKKVDEQLTHAIHVKDRYANGIFIDKLTKWYQ